MWRYSIQVPKVCSEDLTSGSNLKLRIPICGVTVPSVARQTAAEATESISPLRYLNPLTQSANNQKDTLEYIQGEDKVKIYQANVGTKSKPKKRSSRLKKYLTSSGNKRHFCPECGSHLYCYNDSWPQWIYPYPSCIDTDLPAPEPDNMVYICEDSKVSWVKIPEGGTHFGHYPELGIEEWHKKHGCFYGDEKDEEPEAKKQKTTK